MTIPHSERARAGQRDQVALASSVNLLAGIWLICAPFVLTYSDVGNALWNDVVLGATIATIATFRVFGAYRQAWLSWTNALLGCWLVIEKRDDQSRPQLAQMLDQGRLLAVAETPGSTHG